MLLPLELHLSSSYMCYCCCFCCCCSMPVGILSLPFNGTLEHLNTYMLSLSVLEELHSSTYNAVEKLCFHFFQNFGIDLIPKFSYENNTSCKTYKQ